MPIIGNRAEIVVPVYLTATKTVTGAPIPGGKFTFGVFNAQGNLIATAINDENGNIVFPRIYLTSDGVHNYSVRELTPSGNGWTTDQTVFPVIITVRIEEGNWVAHVDYPDGTPSFNNHFYSQPTAADIIAYKVIRGGTGMEVFNFELLDASGDVIATAQNDALGVIHFPSISYSMPGIYTYTIRETGTYPGWIIDPGEFHVIVRVIDSGIVISIEYPDGPPHFFNRFVGPEPGCTVNAQQLIDVRVPVTVTPFANVGRIAVICCGQPTISSGIDDSQGIPGGDCQFTISQRLCAEVPVEFGATVEPGITHVSCEGQDCGNCILSEGEA